ncbi:ESX-4 secretion system protein EccC4 [Mycolicibacterium murale]|uniref:ESX-4 secretion system protein EccC4 n=2 Tax=Mycolicibacterium murale TaxID=182220 RepID=A0A7I9WVB7_9MYCO|nr:ESX-4 secretion system protein EccC4 [Mycolicibacterium murale]
MHQVMKADPPAPTAVPVAAPPPVPAAAPAGVAARLIPLSTLGVTAAMVAAVLATDSPLSSSPMFLMFPLMMAVSALASLAGGHRGTAELDAVRRRYLHHLSDIGQTLTEHAAAQHRWLAHHHPGPESLWQVAGSERRWERRRGHQGFGRIRCGLGEVSAAAQPELPGGTELGDVDPVTTAALQRLLHAYATIRDAPVTVDLGAAALVRLLGDDTATAAWARALLCQLATFHPPADVAIAVAGPEHRLDRWDWLKWLPHHGHPQHCDDVGPARLVYRGVADAVADHTPGRHLVLLVDGTTVTAGDIGDRPDVTVVCLGGAVGTGEVVWDACSGEVRPDALSLPAAAACARRLARRAPAPEQAAGAGDPLHVRLGRTDRGDPVYLDIREAALGGAGPHGLCIGATGSGKSELLRTVAVAMIARHSVDELNLILVDFKGGASFLDLQRAPHVAAVITNLADEAHLVDRMRDALEGEMHRRQQLLREAGNLAKADDYARVRQTRPDLPALPALLVIVDEFSELLSRQPDFIDVFTAIGRVGRSLGIHLLLASQRLDDGRLRGLESHLSYRICLKTLSVAESRAVLGVPDAHHLPATPGSALLKIGAADPVQFRADQVSAPAVPSWSAPARVLRHPVRFTSVPAGPVHRGGADNSSCRSVLETVLDAAAVPGAAAHPVWLAPLRHSPRLADLPVGAGLTVPIGLSDRVFEQRRVPALLNLSGAAGNVAVVGGPRSGKTTVLTTLIGALSLAHGPDELHLYCLDFGGGALAPLIGLPHVGAVAGRRDPELVRRIVAHLVAEVRRRDGRCTAGADTFLLIDGWATFRQEFDDLENTVVSLATEGLAHGVHVVVTATRWADLRSVLKDQLGSRVELRLADPVDSEVDRTRARAVPKARPGSGLTPDGYPMTAALPGDLDALVVQLRARHGTSCAPRVTTLPTQVDRTALPWSADAVLGLGDREMQPVTLDFAVRPHVVILGDAQCGKTAAIRLLLDEIGRTSQAEVHLLDPRRTLHPQGCHAYADSTTQCADLVADLVARLQPRTRAGWTGPQVYLLVDDHELTGRAIEPLVELIPHARDIGLHVVLARRGGARALYDPVLTALRDCGAVGLQMSQASDDAGRARVLPPGRATVVVGAEQQVVQLAWVPPR